MLTINLETLDIEITKGNSVIFTIAVNNTQFPPVLTIAGVNNYSVALGEFEYNLSDTLLPGATVELGIADLGYANAEKYVINPEVTTLDGIEWYLFNVHIERMTRDIGEYIWDFTIKNPAENGNFHYDTPFRVDESAKWIVGNSVTGNDSW